MQESVNFFNRPPIEGPMTSSPVKRNPNFIEVSHGRLRVNVPLSVFDGTTYHIRAEEAEKLKRTLVSRYPWLSENALEVFIKEAEQAMRERIQSRLGFMDKARHAMRSGDYQKAKRMAERRIERVPEDSDAWYVLGESLCKLGESERGHAALTRARVLSKKI